MGASALDPARQDPTASLPEAHLTALLMRGAGRPDTEIAERLGVPLEAVAGLLLIATRKAARALGSAPDEMEPPGRDMG